RRWGSVRTVQRFAEFSGNSIAVNICVPSGNSGLLIRIVESNNGTKSCRTYSLPAARLTKTEIGFRGAALVGGGAAGSLLPSTFRSARFAFSLDVAVLTVLLSTATASLGASRRSDAVFAFGTKRCGLATSTG